MTKRIVAAMLMFGAMAVGSAAVFGDDAKPPPPKTDKPTESKPAPPPEPVAVPKCHAVEKNDPTKVIAEVEDKSITTCTRLLMAKVKEAKCTDAAMKGKQFQYTTRYDHMTGTGKNARKMKDSNTGVTCPK